MSNTTMTKVALLPRPPAQVAASGKPAITSADLSTEFYNEARIHDLLLADRLGFKRLSDIRELIDRNRAEMETYGALARQGDGNIRYGTENSPARRRGRPGKEYWLNEGQALLICALARTTMAARIRRELITVFMAHRAGTMAPAVHVEPQMAELAAMATTVDKMRAEVNALNRKVGSLLATIDGQGKALEIASRKAAAKLCANRVVAGPIVPPAALLYGAAAIAQYLNLQPRQARFLVETGRIPSFHIGKRLCCTTEALDRWMASMAADRKAVLS